MTIPSENCLCNRVVKRQGMNADAVEHAFDGERLATCDGGGEATIYERVPQLSLSVAVTGRHHHRLRLCQRVDTANIQTVAVAR